MPNPDLFTLKQKIDLGALIRSDGVELKPHGKDLVGRCPMHDDRTPSLVVTPAKGLWHCMGACSTGGSAVDWLMKFRGLEYRAAVDALREMAGGDSKREAIRAAVEHYHKTLKRVPAAKDYLKSRGITDAKLLKKFQVGFCDASLGDVLPHRQGPEGKRIRAALREFGLMKPTGFEHFRNCLTFPFLDESGEVVDICGRKIQEIPRERHMQLPGPLRGVWNRAAMESRELILCEAVLDALTFAQHGMLNVTAMRGTEAYTDELHKAIMDGAVEVVHFAFDRDPAGDRAAVKIADKLLSEGIECRRVLFPMGMDANEYALKVSPAAESLRILIESGEPIEPGGKLKIGRPAPKVKSLPPLEGKSMHDEPNTNVERGELDTVIEGDQVTITLGERRYRARGLFRNTADHVLRVNLRVSYGDEFHLDTFDLYDARRRDAFVTRAAKELRVEDDLIKADVGRVLDRLEELQRDRLKKLHEPEEKVEIEISPERREKALELAKKPDLWKHITLHGEQSGLVGERVNFLTGYLAAVSRKTEAPLAVIVQSSSSAGKSTLMDAVLKFVPEEDCVRYSFMTGQSLYYMQSRDLKYKILAIAEEEGAERAKYALKILQSEGRISIVSTVKDETTGLPDAKEFQVEGPTMIMLTTTNVEIDEELQNRALILTINEEREQTRRIQELQRERETLEGILTSMRGDANIHLHQDFQRLLRPLRVVNPFAKSMEFPDTHLRMRRDQRKFLTLIRAVALLHQYSREVKSSRDPRTGESFEYVEATKADIYLAKFLSTRVFGISLDELAPQTRKLLGKIQEFVSRECESRDIERNVFRFTRREIREHTGISDTRLRAHMDRMVELEYLNAYGGGQGRLTKYELVYDGQGGEGESFVPGLKSPDPEEERRFTEEFIKFFN